MKLSDVIKKTNIRVKQAGSQAAYQKQIKIDKTSLSLFINGHLSYVPTPILKDLEIEAETITTYHKIK